MYDEEDTFEALQLRVVIDEHGNKQYYNHENKLHRVFGPAAIYADGDKMWYLNGERHRTDGPAIEWASGIKFWYLNGIELTEPSFLKHPLCTIK